MARQGELEIEGQEKNRWPAEWVRRIFSLGACTEYPVKLAHECCTIGYLVLQCIVHLTCYNIHMEKVVHKHDLHDRQAQKRDLAYWLSKSPRERVAAVEALRRLHYGDIPRLQRVARITELRKG